ERRRNDSLAQVEAERHAQKAEENLRDQQASDTLPIDTISIGIPDADSLEGSALQKRFGVLAEAAKGEAHSIAIENEDLHVTFDTRGARPTVINLKKFRTYEGGPL